MEVWTPQGYSDNSEPPEHVPFGGPLLVLDRKRHEHLLSGAASTSGSELRFGV